jgi:hypothetical protein
VKPSSFLAASLLATIPASGVAGATCPIELATYLSVGHAARLEFSPTLESATVTNTFRMLAGDIVLDGLVQWSVDVPRPWGMLMQDCPKGDVTGAELAACTVWQGVIYASDLEGNVGLLPEEGQNAPNRLIFPDLEPSLAVSAANADGQLAGLAWDVFALQGCRE